MYKRVVYWFKRDLRIDDNRAFWEACKNSQETIPIFIFIPSLLDRFKSHDSRLGFIVDCISYLSQDIKNKGGRLFCYYDEPLKIFEYIIEKYKPQAVYTNKAFSWTGEEIEEKIELLCRGKNIAFHSIKDNFLSNIDKIPYTKIYSAFYKKWKLSLTPDILLPPEKINTPTIKETEIKDLQNKLKFELNKTWKSDFGKKRLNSFDFSNYENTRDKLDLDGTSKLSPYIRFGVLSLRKIYKRAIETAGEDCQFIKELAWREFWYHIKFNFPEFKNLEFQEKRRSLHWYDDENLIKAFINAQTGYPIVDAAIIQLKQEGWMHNRARMIVANFLTKDLLVDWRMGESFFMEYLLDYDEVVNTGNWQWNASVGPDPRPLRIFNPIIQAEKFDPHGEFIKKYIPELRNMKAFELHNPLKFSLPYYKPIVNHYERVISIRKFYSANKENI